MSKDNKMAVVCLVGAALLIILNVFYINHKIKRR